MTDDEIIAALRRGVPAAHVAKMGPTLHRVRRLQATWAPETRGMRGHPFLARRRIKGNRLWLRVPDEWQWVEVSRETDADSRVVSIKVEVSE